MSLDMEDFTLDMIIAQAKAAQLKKEANAEKLPALFDKTLDALVSACEKLEAITAERDQLVSELEEVKAMFVDAIGDGWYDGYMERIKDEKSDDCDDHSFTEEDVMHWSERYESEHRYSKSIADIRAKAVMNFAEVNRGAYLSGFVTAELTVYDVYQSARNHVKDNYGYDTQPWDDDDAKTARNAVNETRAKAIRKFVSDTNETGQLSFSDCQWLEDWRDEWLEEAAKDGE